jgi:hypothetical protein
MKTMSNNNHNSKSTLLLAVALITLAAVAIPSATAADKDAPPPITIASLAGSWEVEFFTTANCGNGTHLWIFTLNSSGVSDDFADTYNTSSCGQGQNHDETFTIETLNVDGTGTAKYSNGTLPLTFNIQVNTATNVFSLVDITDKGQYWSGTAIKQ